MYKTLAFICIFCISSTLTSDRIEFSGRKIFKKDSLNYTQAKFAEYEIVSPRCIPLLSKNINANPYHPSLLSLPHKLIRTGLGNAITISSLGAYYCNSKRDCDYKISQTISETISDTYTISLSSSNTISHSLGTSNAQSLSNELAKSIGTSLEKSLSNAKILTDSNSETNSISEAIRKNHEKSSGLTKTIAADESSTSTMTQDITKSNTTKTEFNFVSSKSNQNSSSKTESGNSHKSNKTINEDRVETNHGWSVGVSLSKSFFGVGVGVSTGYKGSVSKEKSKTGINSFSEETNWQNTFNNTEGSSTSESTTEGDIKSISIGIGRSTGTTKSFSSSSTDDNRISDSISVTRDAARALMSSQSHSDSITNSKSHSFRIDDSFVSTEENSIEIITTNRTENTHTITKEKSRQYSYEVSKSFEMTMSIPAGECRMPIAMSHVKAIVIPYECVREEVTSDDNGGEMQHAHDLIPVTYMITDTAHKSELIYSMVDCSQRDLMSQYFKPDHTQYLNANHENSLNFGDELRPGSQLRLRNGTSVVLELRSDGILVLMKNGKIVWNNSMGFFEGYRDIRVRINEKGHLIEEVKGLFSKSVPGYRENEWITVWSSAPINHNVTIGIPKLIDMPNGYKLIVESTGHLNLYDAAGIVIWSATEYGAAHKRGYMFPEVYLVPTNFQTPFIRSDKHNSFNLKGLNVRYDLMESGLMSLDSGCRYLNSSDAIVSQNKRFTMLLEPSGNMVIKDGSRSMWESASANLPHAKAPYKLFVNPIGEIMIMDALNTLVWSALLSEEHRNGLRPFKLELLDEGRLVVRDSTNGIVWESWPMNGMSFGSTIFEEIRYKFVRCHGKVKNGFAEQKFKNGDFYRGNFEDSKRHGYGTLFYKNGMRYDGHWKNDKMNGYGEIYWKNGNKYFGDWKEGKITGNGTFYWINGTSYSGEIFEGRQNGMGRFEYVNGDKFVGLWKDGMKNGVGVFYYKNGNKYEAYYVNDRVNGSVKFSYLNGDVYLGGFEDGKLNGNGTYLYFHGDVYVGEFKDGIMNGFGKLKYVNGDVYEGLFKDGKRNGMGCMVWVDGDKYEGDWADDKMHGFGKFFYENGNRYEGEFKDDLREGNGKLYGANGDGFEGEWKDDSKNGNGIYYNANGKSFKGIWRNDVFLKTDQ